MQADSQDAFEAIYSLARTVSNWGRWGDEDQIGTQNLVDASVIAAASREVRSGRVFNLGIPIGEAGPQGMWTPENPRTNPIHVMTSTGNDQGDSPGVRFADDALFIPLQAATQWDSLGHAHYDGELYNGYSSQTITVRGLEKNSIFEMRRGVVGRGVLLDVAGHRGVEHLEAGDVVTGDELDEVRRAFGIELHSGDVVLIRTGWWGAYESARVSRADFMSAEPGIGLSCVPWLHRENVSALGADNFAVEVVPAEDRRHKFPIHMLAIRDMGLTLGEFFRLDDLAAECARDGRYTFFFCAPPLPVVRGAASPINPIVVK